MKMETENTAMDDTLKRIEKYFLRDEEDTAEKLRSPRGYVDPSNQPYDRLRRSLRRIFPGYPDVFDHNGSANADER